MKKKIYESLVSFYGIKKEPKTKIKKINKSSEKKVKPKKPPFPTYRMMFLPKGILGADGKAASLKIINTLKLGTTIEYHMVDNDSETERADILQAISEQFNKWFRENHRFDGYATIAFISIRDVPNENEIRRAIGGNPYSFNVIDIYKYGTPRQTPEENQAQVSTIAPSIVQNASYADVPMFVFSEFMLHHAYAKTTSKSMDVNALFAGKDFLRAGKMTKTKAGHLYIPLKDKGKSYIDLYRWCDTNIDLLDLYDKAVNEENSGLFCDNLGKSLRRYMVYNYMHRQDPTDEMYINHIVADPKATEWDTLEDGLTAEAEIMRSTLITIRNASKVISQKATVCELDGKPVEVNPPAVVEYTGSVDNPLPYEGIICNYLKRMGYIGRVANDHCVNFHIEDQTESEGSAGWNVFQCTDDATQIPVLSIQKINTLIKRDPDTGVMVIRGQDDVVRSAILRALTGGDVSIDKSISYQTNNDLMLTGNDFIYDPRLKKPAEEKEEKTE